MKPNRSSTVILSAVAICFVVAPLVAPAQDTAGPADQAMSDTYWYDSDADQVLPIHVQPQVDDSLNRNSRWLPKAKRVRKPRAAGGGGGGTGGLGGTGLFGSGLTAGNLFGWLLLAAIVITIVCLLLYALSKAEIDLDGTSKAQSAQDGNLPDEQTLERMKHLPAELRRTDVNLRSEAERLMNEARYDQAIILLFGHQLLLLDRAGLLRLNRGKTNGKYVRETRMVDPEAAKLLRQTVSTFERSYFGRHEIAQRQFSEIWRGNLELEESVRRRQELAA